MNKLYTLLFILSPFITFSQALDLEDFYDHKNLGIYGSLTTHSTNSLAFKNNTLNNTHAKKTYSYLSFGGMDVELSYIDAGEFCWEAKFELLPDLWYMLYKMIFKWDDYQSRIDPMMGANFMSGYYWGEYRGGWNIIGTKNLVANLGGNVFFYTLSTTDNTGQSYMNDGLNLAAGPYLRIDKQINYWLAARLLYGLNFTYLNLGGDNIKPKPWFHEINPELFTVNGFFMGYEFTFATRLHDRSAIADEISKTKFHTYRGDLKLGWRFRL